MVWQAVVTGRMAVPWLGGGQGVRVRLAWYPAAGDGVPLVPRVTAIESAQGQGSGPGVSRSALVRQLLLLLAGVRCTLVLRRVSPPCSHQARLTAVPPLACPSDPPPLQGAPPSLPQTPWSSPRPGAPTGASCHDLAAPPKAEPVGVLVQDFSG